MIFINIFFNDLTKNLQLTFFQHFFNIFSIFFLQKNLQLLKQQQSSNTQRFVLQLKNCVFDLFQADKRVDPSKVSEKTVKNS